MLRTTLTAALAAALAGCVLTTPTYQTESAFVIYDVRPASINRNALLNAITQAVQKHMTQVRANRDIPPAELPDKPGRIALKKPLGNSGLATLMAASGQSVTVPTCEGQILTIAASDTSKARYGERTEFFLCVLPYKEGYHVDIHVSYARASGATSSAVLGATLARTVVGDASQFIPRTIGAVRAAAEGLGATVGVVNSYVPESFKGPFLDQAASVQQ